MKEENIFRKGTIYRRNKYFNELVNIKGWRCECCGRRNWNGLPIRLQVHHIDNDKTNNELINLRLLCANCHSQTDNWSVRKDRRK